MTANYTPLETFAAELSGKLCLDAQAVPEHGAIEIYASQVALRDNRDRLRDEGYRAEIDIEHDPMRLLVYPSDDDFTTESDGGSGTDLPLYFECLGLPHTGVDGDDAREIAQVVSDDLAA